MPSQDPFEVGDIVRWNAAIDKSDFKVVAVLERMVVKTVLETAIKNAAKVGEKLNAEFDGYEYYIEDIDKSIYKVTYGPIKEEDLYQVVKHHD